jgi:hypothetical protein
VGIYASDNGNIEDGFLLRKGTFTTIAIPGATFTAANGINSRGEIMGFGGAHGFLLRNGTFMSIDVDLPGALPGNTFPNGINSWDPTVTAAGTGMAFC